MPRTWNENFDFYEAAARSGRAMISIDLAAAQHAPIATHPIRFQFRVKMQQPREDGLRSDVEAEAMFALESRLVTVLENDTDAIYVGRAVAYGYTEFFFYVPADKKNAAPPVQAALPYALEFFAEADPEWTKYFELYPSAFSVQTIMNRQLVRQMLEAGDQLAVPRLVDHVALFEDEAKARAAAKDLAAAGFSVDEPKADEDEETWALEFHRVDRADGRRPDEFVNEIFQIIGPHDGDYDGWGSPVQKAGLN